MFNELNNQLYQYFYNFVSEHLKHSDSFFGPEIGEKLLSADAWLCVVGVYIMAILILKFPVGFILEYFWSKALGGYVRDRGKRNNTKAPYRPFNFFEEHKEFQSKGN